MLDHLNGLKPITYSDVKTIDGNIFVIFYASTFIANTYREVADRIHDNTSAIGKRGFIFAIFFGVDSDISHVLIHFGMGNTN